MDRLEWMVHFDSGQQDERDLRYIKGVFALVAVLISFLFWIQRSRTATSGDFRNEDGRSMVEIEGDCRFRKFAQGSAVSDEGYQKAKGDPFIVWNGSEREVVINAPEHTRDFFQGDAKDHGKVKGLIMGHYFGRLLGDCLGIQSGPHWKANRSSWDPFFSHGTAMSFRNLFSKEVCQWLSELRSEFGEASDTPVDFTADAVEACRILPFKLIALTCYGPDLLDDKAFAELLELNTAHDQLVGQAVFGKRTISPWFGLLPTVHKRKMDKFKREWQEFNLKMVRKAQEAGVPCPVANVYQTVEPNGPMSLEEFLQTIDEILFTNIDVTSTVLAFLLINLAATLPTQKQLREEIQRECDINDPNTIETYIAKTNTFLEYTCLESLRLCPATWFSLPEYSPNTKRIAGYLVPANTPIIIDWKRLNTASPIWNPPNQADAETPITGHTFSPQRFEQLSASQYRYSFLRYGLGPRKCLGKNFAMIIMKMMLVEVLTNYQLQFLKEEQEKGEQRAFDLRDDRLTVTPKQRVQFLKI